MPQIWIFFYGDLGMIDNPSDTRTRPRTGWLINLQHGQEGWDEE